MLHIHFILNCLGLSDSAMEVAFLEIVSTRRFVGLTFGNRIPDVKTIFNFGRLIETNELVPLIFERVNANLSRKGLMLEEGKIMDATIIAVPSATKNGTRERDSMVNDTKKVNQWRFGMNAHIVVSADRDAAHRPCRRQLWPSSHPARTHRCTDPGRLGHDATRSSGTP